MMEETPLVYAILRIFQPMAYYVYIDDSMILNYAATDEPTQDPIVGIEDKMF